LSRSKNPIEELLGSRGRIRILNVLAESGDLNISEVSRRTGLNYTSVERHLSKLVKLGLIKEKRYGKIRIFQTVFKVLTVKFEKGAEMTMSVENTSKE